MNKGCGIIFHADDTAIHRNIILKNLDISGFGQHGIILDVPNIKDAVFSKVQIEMLNLMITVEWNNDKWDLSQRGHYSIEDLLIDGCETYNNSGILHIQITIAEMALYAAL